jgi:hypothetical protein
MCVATMISISGASRKISPKLSCWGSGSLGQLDPENAAGYVLATGISVRMLNSGGQREV